MGRRKTRVPLDVFCNGRLLGKLEKETSGAIRFSYAESWLGWQHAFAVSLSLPLREQSYTGAAVLAVFDNLLPDNETVRRRIAARTRAAGADTYNLLSAVGRDCVGALQLLPEGEVPGEPNQIRCRPVDRDYIAGLLTNGTEAPLGISQDGEFRISLAGTQEKTALLLHEGVWTIPLGSTATSHILKPAIGRLSNGIDLSLSVENEYFCMSLAEAFGLPVARAGMDEFAGVRTLVVERFDRIRTLDGRLLRKPQEDMCQALGFTPGLKYQSDGGPGAVRILDLLKSSDDPDKDRLVFFRALVFFWLAGATDGHAKNFSIFNKAGGGFELAPLYDILSAQPNLDAGEIQKKHYKLAMCLGIGNHYKLDSILPRHFLQSALSAGISEVAALRVMDDLAAKTGIATTKALAGLPAGFPAKLADSICSGIHGRAVLLRAGDTVTPLEAEQ